MSIDEWVEENCKILGKHIMTHLECMCPLLSDEETYDTWRMIMISIRADYKRWEYS
jgi:hypothetical protein